VGDVVTIESFGHRYKIVNPGPGRVGSKLANGEPYEKKLLQEIARQGFVGTAFDIGAHIGNHALYLAAVCGLRVHAWEPFAESRAALEHNLTLNPHLKVEVHSWAAGDRDTFGRFTKGMWIEFDPTRDGAAMKIDRGDIPVHRIDDHVQVDDLAVVKVDVEGMEADALRGAIRNIERCLPVVYAEAHTADDHDKVADVLEPLGYIHTYTVQMGSPMDRWVVPNTKIAG
jgi:FkbM family methyltransferase